MERAFDMKADKMNIKDAYDEYQYFLLKYLLPLLGISYDKNLREIADPSLSPGGPYIRQDGGYIYFSTYDKDVFYMEWKSLLAEDDISLAREVIRAFHSVSKYRISRPQTSRNRHPSSINLNYRTDAIREENYRLAVQKGVCDWCAGKENEAFYHLIQILEQWSVQTYEGNHVTLGFIYDPSVESHFSADGYGDWLDFLEDDYAATLTDCIHSVIKVDKNCDFVGYLSVTEGNTVEKYKLSPLLPYRFARIIEKHVKGTRVGVFLLSNGDILIFKNQAVRLIKRNLKWLNLGYETFFNMVESKVKPGTISEDLIEQIYASVLDVSFSHMGGIIAVVSDVSDLTSTKNSILNACDNLLDNRTSSEIAASMQGLKGKKKLPPAEIQKRILKRKTIRALVGDKKFLDLDRKLRTELISMDGACILNVRGDVCAVGAIICNDSGSSGGGRSAAAKKLSGYDGVAVKISTDGYIELFAGGRPVYAIK